MLCLTSKTEAYLVFSSFSLLLDMITIMPKVTAAELSPASLLASIEEDPWGRFGQAAGTRMASCAALSIV